MSRVCEICGKSKVAGNTVTFSHKGIRRTWTPNLRRVRVYDENGTPSRKYVCTRCLRSGLVQRNKPNESVYTESDNATIEANENLTADVQSETPADVVSEVIAEEATPNA